MIVLLCLSQMWYLFASPSRFCVAQLLKINMALTREEWVTGTIFHIFYYLIVCFGNFLEWPCQGSSD